MEFLVSYDVMGENPDYSSILEELKRLEAVWKLKSTWIVSADFTTTEIFSLYLRQFFKGEFGLIVVSLEDGTWTEWFEHFNDSQLFEESSRFHE